MQKALTQERTELTRISPAPLINFLLQKCGVHLRMMLNAMVIPVSTVSTQISAAVLINFSRAYSSNRCNC